MSGPLTGVRVVDVGSFITGPFAAMLLADLGAEVIKVERPGGGDPFRSFERGLYGPQFRAFNRSKKSIVLDPDDDGDRSLIEELVRRSDVFIQNTRPGALEKRGLGAERLRAVNPRLVYCAITGFGRDGPEAQRPAYDTVAQAASGYLSLFVSPGDTTIKGPAVADVVTGLYAANGILAALNRRHATGKGALVEVAMVAAAAHFASEPYQHYFEKGVPPAPAHRSHISQSFAFECADGRILAVHMSSPEKFWQGLLTATGRHDLATDPRFSTRLQRIANYDALEDVLKPVFRQRPLAEWLDLMTRHDVPHAAAHSLPDALAQPQARHLGIEMKASHPTEGDVRGIASPIAFDGERFPGFEAPPTLDEHGAELRDWLSRPASG
ncbi:MAG: CoA transferase [Rhizobiaceae bacterium]